MRRVSVLAMLTLSLAPIAATAQVQTYYHAGAWTTFSERDDKGNATCGMGNTNPADNRRFAVRFTIGGTETSFIASKPNWAIPNNARVPVVMQLGLNVPWGARAIAGGKDITWTLDHVAYQTFDQQFRTAPLVTVTFPDGNEPPWVLPLTGSAAVAEAFAKCVRDLTRQIQAAQAPAVPSTPVATQPFAAPPH